jgi:Asp-tRNA(Asn)/Glu-tRNA(Gln) amidotransferase A subunit family amidase
LNGLPIGLQLVSPGGREALLFSVASRIERRNVIAVALTGRDQ